MSWLYANFAKQIYVHPIDKDVGNHLEHVQIITFHFIIKEVNDRLKFSLVQIARNCDKETC